MAPESDLVEERAMSVHRDVTNYFIQYESERGYSVRAKVCGM